VAILLINALVIVDAAPNRILMRFGKRYNADQINDIAPSMDTMIPNRLVFFDYLHDFDDKINHDDGQMVPTII
jgi:hypothetical protein